ncbi:hypothetical protein TcCL_NonESM05089 [Trypanosoma cruzi]|nr:hypothetical protein TcCL_NonESM05089 [Trypanosoma cruzi]
MLSPFREAELPRFPSVHFMFCLIYCRAGQRSRCGTVSSHSSRWIGFAIPGRYPWRAVPCGGGSVRHCRGTKNRTLGGKIRALVIPSGVPSPGELRPLDGLKLATVWPA